MAQNRTAKNQVNFRVDDKEYAILKAKAEVAGLSPSMFAKQQALNGRVKAPVITKDIGQLILPEISKIGSNVNQIARKLNQGGSPMLSEFKEIQAEFETLWAYVLDGKKPKPRSKSEEEKLEQEQDKHGWRKDQKSVLYAAALPFASILTSTTKIFGFARTTPRRKRVICLSGWSKWLM